MRKILQSLSILIIGMSVISCKKELPKPPVDLRDQVVGEYEVFDSLYVLEWDSVTGASFVLDAVFHYTKVTIEKKQVLFDNGAVSHQTEGLLYTVHQIDTTIYGRSGSRYGLFAGDQDYYYDSGPPFILLAAGHQTTFGPEPHGTVNGSEILFVDGGWTIGKYSSAVAKRK